MKNLVLQKLHDLMPFDARGDLTKKSSSISKENFLSCLTCASQRPKDLDVLLEELALQTLPINKFEVIIVNDGGGEVISRIIHKYKKSLDIKEIINEHPSKIIGAVRNQTLAVAQGEYILFIDDDTRIIQNNFLEHSLEIFQKSRPDVILPCGLASYGIVKLKYDFFDSFSFGNGGILYTKKCLEELGGFRNDLPAYEDIELGIRLTILNKKVIRTKELVYLHPPFYFTSMQKSISIGQSILKLRNKYPLILWLLIYINSLRFLPLILVPTKINLQWFQISLGALIAPFVRKSYFY